MVENLKWSHALIFETQHYEFFSGSKSAVIEQWSAEQAVLVEGIPGRGIGAGWFLRSLLTHRSFYYSMIL